MRISYHVQFALDLSGNGLEGFGRSLVVWIPPCWGCLLSTVQAHFLSLSCACVVLDHQEPEQRWTRKVLPYLCMPPPPAMS